MNTIEEDTNTLKKEGRRMRMVDLFRKKYITFFLECTLSNNTLEFPEKKAFSCSIHNYYYYYLSVMNVLFKFCLSCKFLCFLLCITCDVKLKSDSIDALVNLLLKFNCSHSVQKNKISQWNDIDIQLERKGFGLVGEFRQILSS